MSDPQSAAIKALDRDVLLALTLELAKVLRPGSVDGAIRVAAWRAAEARRGRATGMLLAAIRVHQKACEALAESKTPANTEAFRAAIAALRGAEAADRRAEACAKAAFAAMMEDRS